MAGAMRKVAVYLGLAEEDEGYEHDEAYADEQWDARGNEPRAAEPRGWEPRQESSLRVARPAEPAGRPVTSAGPREAAVGDAGIARITTLHPRNYNEAVAVGQHFREGVPVIMNLTDMEDADAKRIVDFAAGLAFGRFGSIEKVTAKVFLLTPADVEITAEDKTRIASGGLFNQS